MTSDKSETRYASGASLYVFDHDVDGWQRRAAFLRQLPGLSHIQLWLEQLDLDEDEQTRLRESLAGLRVTVHAPCLQLSMISHHDAVRGAAAEGLRRAMRLSAMLGAEVLTLIGGQRPFFMDETVAVDQVQGMLAAINQEGGPRIALRNQVAGSPPPPGERGHGGDRAALEPFPATLEDLRACLARVPEVGLTLDVGACTAGREAWIGFLRGEAARLRVVHLHDAQPGGAAHLPLGSGGLDAFALARLLRATDYRGFVTLTLGGKADTQRSWELWRRAQEEAAQEPTATLSVSRPPE